MGPVNMTHDTHKAFKQAIGLADSANRCASTFTAPLAKEDE